MANQFKIFQSSDASAPVLNQTVAGSFIALLDACLVTGYGSKLAAGWSKAFSGTNLAAYQAPTGIRHFLKVTNTGGSPSGQAFESMTDISTGINPYAGTFSFFNSTLTAAPWVVAADDRTFYTFIQIAAASVYLGFTFGEFYSFVANDNYRGIARFPSNTGSLGTDDNLDLLSSPDIAAAASGAYIARSYTGMLPAITPGITGDGSKCGGSSLSGQILPTPNPTDGGLYLSPLWISDRTTAPAPSMRGRMRGLWQLLNLRTGGINNGDTISGTGDLSGKSFLLVYPSGNTGVNGAHGVYVIETSATLETN